MLLHILPVVPLRLTDQNRGVNNNIFYQKVKVLTFWWRGWVVVFKYHLQFERTSFPWSLQRSKCTAS